MSDRSKITVSNLQTDITGRFVTPPALQNIPIRDKELKRLNPLVQVPRHTERCPSCASNGYEESHHKITCAGDAECDGCVPCYECLGVGYIECSADECDDTCNTCANA